MTIQIAAFDEAPSFAQGSVRDLRVRVRRAPEGAGQACQGVFVDPPMKASAGYRRWQPFGQVAAYRDDEVELFESGAIVLHFAATSDELAPRDRGAAARVAAWASVQRGQIEASLNERLQALAELRSEQITARRLAGHIVATPSGSNPARHSQGVTA